MSLFWSCGGSGGSVLCWKLEKYGNCRNRETCPYAHPKEFKKDKPKTDPVRQGQGQGYNGNRSGRGQGGKNYSKKRNHSTDKKQAAPNQANHLDAGFIDENDFHIDAFGGQGFQQ